MNSSVTPIRSPARRCDASITVLWVTAQLPDRCVLMHSDKKILSQITGVSERICRVAAGRTHASNYSKCAWPSFWSCKLLEREFFIFIKMLIEMRKLSPIGESPSVPCEWVVIQQNRTGNGEWCQFTLAYFLLYFEASHKYKETVLKERVAT